MKSLGSCVGRWFAAGLAVGVVWGGLSSIPVLSYLLALPGGDWAETVCEQVLRAIAPWGTPPSRTWLIVGLHAALFGVAAIFPGIVVGWLGRGARAAAIPAAVLAAVVALAAACLLPLIWSMRGVEGGVLAWLAAAIAVAAPSAALAAALSVSAGALAARGWLGGTVVAIAVLAVAGWGVSAERVAVAESASSGGARAPLLLIGIDAASWANLEPGMASGALPNLAALAARSARGEMQSLAPTFSPIIWTTMVTGVDAERHGIRDFTLDGVPYTSNSRRAVALWELLSDAGIPSVFHYWWASWPAEPTTGRIVSEHFLNRALDRRVWPDDETQGLDALADEVRLRAASVESIIGGYPDADFPVRHREKLRVLDQILEQDEVVTELAVRALGEDYPVVSAYLRSPDAAGHKFWKWHAQERYPRIGRVVYGEPDSDVAVIGPVHDRVLQIVDDQVGRLLAAAGPEWNVMLVSDHGMTHTVPVGRDPESEGETGGHHRSGLVLVAGPGVAAGARIRGATVFDVFPTVLYLQGLPVPDETGGRVLAEAFAGDFRDSHPMRRGEALAVRDVGDPTPIATGADEDYLDQLRALGYVVD